MRGRASSDARADPPAGGGQRVRGRHFNDVLFLSGGGGARAVAAEQAYVGPSGIRLRVRLARASQPLSWEVEPRPFVSCLEGPAGTRLRPRPSSEDEGDAARRDGEAMRVDKARLCRVTVDPAALGCTADSGSPLTVGRERRESVEERLSS
jgi:hypothetical protein